MFKSPFSKGAFPASTESIPHVPVWPAGVAPAVEKERTMCQILEVLLAWITLGATSLLFWSEWMPGKPVTVLQPKCICSHRIPKIKLLLTEKKPIYYPKVCIYDLLQRSSSLIFSHPLTFLITPVLFVFCTMGEEIIICVSADNRCCSSSSNWKQQLMPLLIFTCAPCHSPLCESILKKKLGNGKDDVVPLEIYLWMEHF